MQRWNWLRRWRPMAFALVLGTSLWAATAAQAREFEILWTVSQGNGPDLRGLYVESVLRQLPPSEVAEYAWACDGEAPVSGSVATGTVARLRPDAEP